VRWLADECVDAKLVGELRRAGEDVVYIAETSSGATDTNVIERAQRERRVLLTEDKDFGDLVFRQYQWVPGVVFLRIPPERRAVKWQRLQAAVAKFGEGLMGRYTVVEPARLRSRPLRRDPA
jgi:predicted nuclease of predicted toxin-antitoxin system